MRSTGKGSRSAAAISGRSDANALYTAAVLTTWLSPPSRAFSTHSKPTMSALSVWKGCAAAVVYRRVAGSVGSFPRSFT